MMTTTFPAVIELRQYTLRPGQREVLIELFEREFVESQEALGLRVLGTFRDLDDPDRFVWLRGFADMATRATGLAAFYGGPVWAAHRTVANATMIDSDDVLLLRASEAQATPGPAGLVTATVLPLEPAGNVDRARWLAAGADWVIELVTDPTPNNFPPLPVRAGEPVRVWLAGFADEAAQRRHARLVGAPAPTLRLAPTARSAIRPAEFVGRPHDFDFLVGTWHVANRRLKQRHVGSDVWDEFPGIERAETRLDGCVSVDQIDFETLGFSGFSGCTLRSLDRAAQRWAIYWINSRVGRVEPPVHGGFCGDRGEFHGDDLDDGRPVRVRFVWERLGADHARWAQAFALTDRPGPPAWETNWVMDMRRAG